MSAPADVRLDGVTVSFDSFRALDGVTQCLEIASRHHCAGAGFDRLNRRLHDGESPPDIRRSDGGDAWITR